MSDNDKTLEKLDILIAAAKQGANTYITVRRDEYIELLTNIRRLYAGDDVETVIMLLETRNDVDNLLAKARGLLRKIDRSLDKLEPK